MPLVLTLGLDARRVHAGDDRIILTPDDQSRPPVTVELVALDRLHKRAVFRVVGTMYALCLSLDERQKVPGCPEAEISPYDIQDQVCRVSIEAPQSIRINRGSHTYAKPVNGAQS